MFETIPEIIRRMKRWQALACPSEQDRAFLEGKVAEASALGMNYREGLEYVICQGNGRAD